MNELHGSKNKWYSLLKNGLLIYRHIQHLCLYTILGGCRRIYLMYITVLAECKRYTALAWRGREDKGKLAFGSYMSWVCTGARHPGLETKWWKSKLVGSYSC